MASPADLMAAVTAGDTERVTALLAEDPALAMARGDEDFRLLVDTALSSTYSSAEFPALYAKYFGMLDDSTRNFFAWVTPPP